MHVVTGAEARATAAAGPGARAAAGDLGGSAAHWSPSTAVPGDDGDADDGPAYEVMYLLDADATRVPRCAHALAGLGDSLVVVGGDGLWNVHVHVDDVGAAVEAGIEAGRPHRVRVTHFAEQRGTAAGPTRSPPVARRGLRRRARAGRAVRAAPAPVVVRGGAGPAAVGRADAGGDPRPCRRGRRAAQRPRHPARGRGRGTGRAPTRGIGSASSRAQRRCRALAALAVHDPLGGPGRRRRRDDQRRGRHPSRRGHRRQPGRAHDGRAVPAGRRARGRRRRLRRRRQRPGPVAARCSTGCSAAAASWSPWSRARTRRPGLARCRRGRGARRAARASRSSVIDGGQAALPAAHRGGVSVADLDDDPLDRRSCGTRPREDARRRALGLRTVGDLLRPLPAPLPRARRADRPRRRCTSGEHVVAAWPR